MVCLQASLINGDLVPRGDMTLLQDTVVSFRVRTRPLSAAAGA